MAVFQKSRNDDHDVAKLIAKGTPAFRLVYEDGSGHHSFREIAMASAGAERFTILDSRTRNSVGHVSRPEVLAAGPREIPVADVPQRSEFKQPVVALKAAPTHQIASRATMLPTPTAATPGPARTVGPKLLITSSTEVNQSRLGR